MPLSQSSRFKLYQPVVLTDEFLITFPIFSADDVAVSVDGAATSAFTVNATFVNGRSDDASITLTAAVTDVDVEIQGARSPRSEASFVSNSPNLAKQVQLENEKITAVQQEQARDTLDALAAASAAGAAGDNAAVSAAEAEGFRDEAEAAAAAAALFDPSAIDDALADVNAALNNFFEIPNPAGNDGKLLSIEGGVPVYVDRNEVLLQSTSLSGLGEVAFTAFNSALYSDYIFSFSGAIVASAASLFIHTSSDGGANYDEGASDYANWKSISTTSSTTATVTANATFGSMSFVNAPQSPGALNGDLRIYGAGEAVPTSIEGTLVASNPTILQRQSVAGLRLASEAVNGVRFDLSSPSTTWTAGTLRVIGVRK